MPAWADIAAWWPLILLNACLAYSLNVITALFIKHSSAVAFVLLGIMKDAAIVMAGALILSEDISRLQGFGFFKHAQPAGHTGTGRHARVAAGAWLRVMLATQCTSFYWIPRSRLKPSHAPGILCVAI